MLKDIIEQDTVDIILDEWEEIEIINESEVREC